MTHTLSRRRRDASVESPTETIETAPAPEADSRIVAHRVETRRERRQRARRARRRRVFAGATGAAVLAACAPAIALMSSMHDVTGDGLPELSPTVEAQTVEAVPGTPSGPGRDGDALGVTLVSAPSPGGGAPGSGAPGGDGAAGGDVAASGLVQWPLASRDASVTSGFGPRIAPCSWGCSSNHRGVDFSGAVGTAIGSIAAGTVVSASYTDNGGLGVHVVVEHDIDGATVRSVYGHMLSGSITVRVGDEVRVGERLGSLGNTGTSTGPHLHLETIVNGVHVDPLSFLYKYADGRDVEIVDRPSVPWNPPLPGGEGEGWTPDQTVTTPPPPGVPIATPDPEPVDTGTPPPSDPSTPSDTGTPPPSSTSDPVPSDPVPSDPVGSSDAPPASSDPAVP